MFLCDSARMKNSVFELHLCFITNLPLFNSAGCLDTSVHIRFFLVKD
jgi:hypothetical protein